jgi:hypothetical protein
MDISTTALFAMHEQGRVKGFTVETPTQLLAIAELLKTSTQGEKVLVILEGLASLFLSQKVS